MVELDRTAVGPPELTAYMAENPTATKADFDDNTFSYAKRAIRDQRNREQGGLCVYCEQELSLNSGHVEHIKPRSAFPAVALAYENLAHSCDGVVNRKPRQHCGHLKDNHVLTQEPGRDCNQAFAISTLDGYIVPAMGFRGASDEELESDIETLGLNSEPLAKERHGWLKRYQELLETDADAEAFLATAPFRHILATI